MVWNCIVQDYDDEEDILNDDDAAEEQVADGDEDEVGQSFAVFIPHCRLCTRKKLAVLRNS